MLLVMLISAMLAVQAVEPAGPLDYVCPMDADIRSAVPGKCTRCGMRLVLGVPDLKEYALDMKMEPRTVFANQPTELIFRVSDPDSGKLVDDFEVVHEKLFHLFIVSDGLDYFMHEHPVFAPDHSFRFKARFPKAGMYRVLSDFYPKGGSPQLLARTALIPESPGKSIRFTQANLTPDLSEKQGSNLAVELVTQPAIPIAGMKTLLFFRLRPAEGIEQYLGAWGHMLAASDDLVDVMHSHPFLADGGPQIQFNMIFPRARTYRLWVQFQRQGVVNTVAFNLPVSALK
jgi:hypothetical protein